MIFIDTGYIVSLLDRRDELHLRAIRWSRFVSEPISVTTAVLLEAANYFSASPIRAGFHSLANQMRQSSECRIVHISQDLFDAGMRLHASRNDKQWSLTDCLSFIVMEQQGITRALTHDHHFQQAGFVPLLRTEPTGS